MSNIIKGITLGDIHFGIKDTLRLYEELTLFKDYLKESDAQLLIFTGDYFERKLSLGELASYYALNFFKEVIEICKDKNIKVRMIGGTATHEANQLVVFKSYAEDLDFKIFETVSEEEILPGFNVLYLPEEYLEDSDEYYEEYKGKKYQAVFGHGTWDFVAHLSQIEHSVQTTSKSAPVFLYKEWKEAVENGFIIFGHIHGRNTYGKKIFYPGSYSRWNYGELSDKGFTEFEYNLDTKKYEVKYIDNTIAPKFDVITIDDIISNVKETKVTEIQSIIDEHIKNFDNIRIDITSMNKEDQLVIQKVYMNHPTVKILVKKDAKALRESVIDIERFTKYDYIISQELPLPEMIYRYIKEDLEEEVSLETIKGILEI